MPGPITHLKAVYYYNEVHSNAFGEAIYLGGISPDSVNVKGHAPKSIRWPAHLRNADLNIWLENAKEFYIKNKGSVDEAFLRGYILHIITDIIWDKEFDMPLFTLLERTGVSKEQLKAERWNELYGYEQQQVTNDWFLKEVLPKIKLAEPMTVGTLKKSEVKEWQDRIVSLQLDVGHPPKFVDDAFLQLFFKRIIVLADEIFENSL